MGTPFINKQWFRDHVELQPVTFDEVAFTTAILKAGGLIQPRFLSCEELGDEYIITDSCGNSDYVTFPLEIEWQFASVTEEGISVRLHSGLLHLAFMDRVFEYLGYPMKCITPDVEIVEMPYATWMLGASDGYGGTFTQHIERPAGREMALNLIRDLVERGIVSPLDLQNILNCS